MNLIITAGGTRERIDTVRTIANEATGRLGSLIAEEFSRRLAGMQHTIYFLHGAGSVLPATTDPGVKPILTENTSDLQHQLLSLLQEQKIDAVVHSMAVSDYKVGALSTPEQIASDLADRLQTQPALPSAEELRAMLLESFYKTAAQAGQKISSELEHPLLLLEKTPKVIESIKKASPGTLLVGFKLLSGVEESTLLQTAANLLLKNGCDFVLANDTASVQSGIHEGYLIDKTGHYQKYFGKTEIAKGIVESVWKILLEDVE